MRQTRAILLGLILAGACNRGRDEPIRLPDGSMLSSAGGEVELADGSQMKFMITSERYKQWEAAKSGLNSSVTARFGTLLRPESPTQQTIERAVAYLETTPVSRQAIERTGMSVRDFVLMTVALEQEMRVAAARGQRGAPVSVVPGTPTPKPDTTISYAPIAPTPAPAPAPPPPPRDSVRRDSVPRDTVLPPPKPKPDSVLPPKAKPDSVLPPKPPRDTVRDTTRSQPRDVRGRM